ncbi:hypothetical protein VM1G_05310 [Cytospora mali]|uniref:Cytochrome b561 domain-containing protein n=1 Tax=Cytospora mali TaxID=578113 RepID=A0A194VZL2_CYTMA|nr:hypothetical protein VM1G_05310 [Valsa mali]
MSRTTTTPIGLLALLATAIITPTHAQLGGGYAGFGGSHGGGDDSPYSGNDGDGDDNEGYDYGLGFGYDGAVRARTAHGILTCVAFVILFPLGGILLRAIPGRWSFHAHWVVQMLAWVLYIAAFALGVELAREIRFPGDNGDFISNPHTNYHPIIGIVVFILLLIQPLLGIIHHQKFKKLQRRTLSSHLHLWDGRVAIVLGIVNGGLGLRLAGATDTVKLAYTIVAAIFGCTWIVLAVLSECRKGRGKNIFGRSTRDGRAMGVGMERIQKVGRRRGNDGDSSQSLRHQDNGRER